MYGEYNFHYLLVPLISAIEQKAVHGLNGSLNSKPQIPVFKGNIDTLDKRYIVVADVDATGTLPSGIGGNRYVIIGESSFISGGLQYGIQMAISFGTNRIAIRNANYNSDAKGKYSDWRYI